MMHPKRNRTPEIAPEIWGRFCCVKFQPRAIFLPGNRFPPPKKEIATKFVKFKVRPYIAPHPAVSVLQFCHQTIYFKGGDFPSRGF